MLHLLEVVKRQHTTSRIICLHILYIPYVEYVIDYLLKRRQNDKIIQYIHMFIIDSI